MIVYLSVIDKHRPTGEQFVGAILVEIPIAVEDTHYSVAAVNCDLQTEPLFRPFLGKLMNKADVTAMDAAIEDANRETPNV